MQISEAESRVMQILWERGASTAEDVVAVLGDAQDWHESTIKTLLGRLMKKGAIAADSEGRRFRYRPLLAESDWRTQQSRGLLDRLFEGRIAPLVAHFSQRGELSREDIAELRKLIEGLDDDR